MPLAPFPGQLSSLPSSRSGQSIPSQRRDGKGAGWGARNQEGCPCSRREPPWHAGPETVPSPWGPGFQPLPAGRGPLAAGEPGNTLGRWNISAKQNCLQPAQNYIKATRSIAGHPPMPMSVLASSGPGSCTSPQASLCWADLPWTPGVLPMGGSWGQSPSKNIS